MAFLVLVSTMGFSLDYHVCQGSIKSFAINGKAKTCLEMSGFEAPEECDSPDSSSGNEDQLTKQQCCTNISAFQTLASELKLVTDQIYHPVLNTEPLYSEISVKSEQAVKSDFDFYIAPPPRSKTDIPLWNQSFLI